MAMRPAIGYLAGSACIDLGNRPASWDTVGNTSAPPLCSKQGEVAIVILDDEARIQGGGKRRAEGMDF